MSKSIWIGAALTALGLAVAAGAARSDAPSGPAPAQIIAARQASLDMSTIVMARLKAAAKAGADVKAEAYPAAALAKWSKALPGMFPAGTGPDAGVFTQAKPAIWSDRAGFEAKAADYAAATAKLVELAKAGDTAGFAAQVATVSAACDACHAAYKASPK